MKSALLAIGILVCAAIPAAAQGAASKQVCMPCTAMCGKCGMGAKCRATCTSNGDPSVTGACKNWFDSCTKK